MNSNLKKYKHFFGVLEIITTSYLIFFAAILLLNAADITTVPRYEKTGVTFYWGLLLIFLAEVFLNSSETKTAWRKKNILVMGGICATTAATCDGKLFLLLLCIIVLILLFGNESICDSETVMGVIFSGSIFLEGYSAFYLITGFSIKRRICGFLTSYYMDLFFLVVCLIYILYQFLIKKKQDKGKDNHVWQRMIRICGGFICGCVIWLLLYYLTA